jgi:hypothetical protein
LNAQFPSAIQPLCYSRIAYYMLMRKQPIPNQTNNHQDDPSQWGDINPIGLWRALKVRLFDGAGNMTGYAFSTNIAWQIVDVILRRKLFPDYSLPFGGGPDPLSAAVSARFNWESIYESAQYYDTFLANGRRRFTGNFCFSNATSLQAILSQMLLCCRSYLQEDAGQIYLRCDKPRPVAFTVSREHILPGTWQADDKNLNSAANRYIAQFRDLLVPACAEIAGITAANEQNPIVTTTQPHCLSQGDWIAMGGTGSVYDGTCQVASVPDTLNVGTPEEIDPTTFTIVRKGANYPTNVGAGGAVGLLYSRFKNRSVEFWHKNNMIARGAVGLGIPRQRNKIKQALDFATCTYDQASRIARYERDRALGPDVSPYVTPAAVSFRLSMFAVDAAGNFAAEVRPGDHIYIDDTTNWAYAGDYEVLEPLMIVPPTVEASGQGGSVSQKPSANSGEIDWTLGPYREDVMYDTSDDAQAGWPSVPGSDPGNDGVFTSVDLANGGNFVFFCGQLASGSQFQLPSSGYPSQNMIAWASPAGANVNYHSIRIVRLCEADSSRNLTLIYDDLEGTQWGGDVGYACVAWLSGDASFEANGITWIELTLLGGETILFGKGVIADGQKVQLPAGYTTDKMFATAWLHDMTPIVRNLQSLGAYVDAQQVVHVVSTDSSSTQEYGNAAVFVFAWKNNMGTVATSSAGGANWMQVTLPNGKIFSLGCAKNLANGATFSVSAAAGDQAALEIIAGSTNGTIVSGHHAQGIGACYVDQGDVLHMTFNNGSGDTWAGTADVIGAFCVGGTAAPPVVNVTPASLSIAQGSSQSLSAQVIGNANQSVTWSVDGIAGGNGTIGTIDANGTYTAPLAAGSHTITATSVADLTRSGSVSITVTGAQSVSFSVATQTLQFLTGSSAFPLAIASNWRLTGGVMTLTSGSSILGSYTVTVSWAGVTAMGSNGAVLAYTDGSAQMKSDQTGYLYVYDPNNAGGNLVTLTTSGMAPTGAEVLMAITSFPSENQSQEFYL